MKTENTAVQNTDEKGVNNKMNKTNGNSGTVTLGSLNRQLERIQKQRNVLLANRRQELMREVSAIDAQLGGKVSAVRTTATKAAPKTPSVRVARGLIKNEVISYLKTHSTTHAKVLSEAVASKTGVPAKNVQNAIYALSSREDTGVRNMGRAQFSYVPPAAQPATEKTEATAGA